MKDLDLNIPEPSADSYRDQLPRPILVTGANGQLGLTIQELYAGNSAFDFTFLSKSQLDITNKKEVEIFFEKYKFDYCINCAAYTNVEQAEKTPDIAYKINAEAVKSLALICKEYKTTLIHISTDYVFDGEKGVPYTIKDLPNPINEYGKSKLLGEQYIQEILDHYFIVRTSWLYSKKYGKNFYRTILEKAQKENELFVTIEQKGCPTDSVNLAKYILNLINLKRTTFGIHHFSDEEAMTWYDFAERILIENHLIDKTKLHKTKKNHTFVKRPQYSVMVKSELKTN